MVFRSALEIDLPGILEILNFEIRNGFAHFGLEEVTLSGLHTEFQSDARTHPWWVAVDESGRVLAYARASPWKTRGAYARTAEVGIYARPECRGKGIGRALYSEFLQDMRAKGFHTLLGGIAQPNPASVRLHEAFGFQHVGTLPEVGFKLGQWRDVGYWALVLGEEGVDNC